MAAEEATDTAHKSWTILCAQYRKYAKTRDCDDGYWSATSPAEQGLASADSARTLSAIRTLWASRRPDLPLPVGSLVAR
jgi:hypothetical protein